MGKFTIRQYIKEEHETLTQEHRDSAERLIFEAIESSEQFKQSRYIAIYHALADEVPTLNAIERWSQMGKVILLPRINGQTMEFYHIDEGELEVGSYGIIEPCGGIPTPPSQIEMMIIPGVAFALDGRRLGRGKGYYDRYLARCSDSIYKVGICFDYQLLEEIPCDEHDVKMSFVYFK